MHLPLRMLYALLVATLLATPLAPVVAGTPVASPVAETPTFRESDCMYDLPPGLTADDVLCGWVTAPMYPDGSKPGTVELPVIRIMATTDSPAPEPLMILLGGPGQNMSSVLPLFGDEAPIWRFMLERQDVILFDQRGMGKSMPTLACPFERTVGESGATEGNTAPGLAIVRCAADVQAEGTDLAAFTTANNAADIDAIRLAMGDEQVDLYGISYGSKLALSAIRDYPDSIRASIIASPLPLESNPFLDQTIGFDAALKQVWDACAADAQCAADNPDPAGAFVAAVDRLQQSPMRIPVVLPDSTHPTELSVDAFQFLQIVYLGVFVGPVVPVLPYLVTSVAAGDDTLLREMAPLLLMTGQLSLGALFTYFCQDEVPFSPQDETDAALEKANLVEPLAGPYWIDLGDQSYQICRMWKLQPADPVEDEAVKSDEPLLILTGAFDPITPPKNGEMIVANFPNGQLVEFAAQGHDPASNDPECANPIITSFLDDPSAPVDSACAADPVEFLSPEDLLAPLATPIASPVPGV